MRLIPVTVTVAILMLIASCVKENHTPRTVDVKQNAKLLTAAGDITTSPERSIIYGAVTVSGSGFGTNPANVTVKFNGVKGIINSIADNKIVATVPAEATSGKITINIGDKTMTSNTDFKILRLIKDGSFAVNIPGLVELTLAFDTTGKGGIYLNDGSKIYKRTTDGAVSVIFKAPPAENGFSYYLGAFTIDIKGNVYVALQKSINAYDDDGILVPHPYNTVVKKITPDGVTSTILGQDTNVGGYGSGGPPIDLKTASFLIVNSLFIDQYNNALYLKDRANNADVIKKVTLNGTVGAIGAYSNYLGPIGWDKYGSNYTLSNGTLNKMDKDGLLNVIAGSPNQNDIIDGGPLQAKFENAPLGLDVDSAGNIFILEQQTYNGITDFTKPVSLRIVNNAGYVSSFGINKFNANQRIMIDKLNERLYLIDNKTITRFSFE